MTLSEHSEHIAVSTSEMRVCISDLADGRLPPSLLQTTVAACRDDAQARATWQAYHVVGDVLRSGDLAGSASTLLRGDFMTRLQTQLAVTAFDLPDTLTAVSPVIQIAAPDRAAANDSTVRWKWAAGFASVLAVVAVAWTMVGGQQAPAGAQLASADLAPMQAIATGATVLPQQAVRPNAWGRVGGALQVKGVDANTEPVMIRDPHLDALLAAHKQFGGASALQGPTGFLRNATFETSGR